MEKELAKIVLAVMANQKLVIELDRRIAEKEKELAHRRKASAVLDEVRHKWFRAFMEGQSDDSDLEWRMRITVNQIHNSESAIEAVLEELKSLKAFVKEGKGNEI